MTAIVVCVAAPSPVAAELADDPVAQHEAEHRAALAGDAARAAGLASLSAAERASLRARIAARREEAEAIPPEEGGAWSAPFPAPVFGEHAVLLPTGRVLLWGLPFGAIGSRNDGGNAGVAWIWDPERGTDPSALRRVDPPLMDGNGTGVLVPAPLHCSGQSLLPDGRLLVTGGNLRGPAILDGSSAGLAAVLTFDPWTETWARQPDMEDGRWYPTQVLTGDGSTYLIGGYGSAPPGDQPNGLLERFADGVVETVGAPSSHNHVLYPRLFALPDGDVAAAGPGRLDVGVLDTQTGAWDRTTEMSREREGGNAVIRPGTSSTVMTTGGHERSQPATATAETIDYAGVPSPPVVEADPPLNVGRSFHNTVLLPDGSMVAVGGGSGGNPNIRAVYPDGRAKAVELWSPDDGSWRLGAAQVEDRGYHSTAVLLPDGRVMSAGDDLRPNRSSDSIEIYSPPYLFRGSRPSLTGVQSHIGYDKAFTVETDSDDVERAVLMAPGATTHGVDMSQRYVELAIETVHARRGEMRVRSPGRPGLAVPGYYMLFLLDADGVPSVARWVQLGAEASPAQDERTPPASAAPSSGSADDASPPPVPGAPSEGGDATAVRDGLAPAVGDGLAPAVRVRVGAAALRRALRTRRLRFGLSVDERATVDARLAAPGPAGTVARLRRVVAAGTTRLALRLPARRGRLLRRRSTLVVVARDDAGNARRVRVRLRLGAGAG